MTCRFRFTSGMKDPSTGQFLICATSFKDVTKFLCDFQNPIFLTGISSPIQVLVHGLYNRIPQILIVEKDF